MFPASEVEPEAVCCPWPHEVMSGYLVELVCEDGSTTLDFWTFKQVCRVMDVGTRALAPAVVDVHITNVTLHACGESQSAA